MCNIVAYHTSLLPFMSSTAQLSCHLFEWVKTGIFVQRTMVDCFECNVARRSCFFSIGLGHVGHTDSAI